MGVIRVKLANNYFPMPADAADDYVDGNKTVKLIAPENIIPGTWKIVGGLELDKGFGAIAKKTDGKWWGFAVCFLFNQSTGFTELYDKHLNNQQAAGAISDEYMKWWTAGNLKTLNDLSGNPNSDSIQDAGTFVHPAYLAVRTLNESSIQDEINIDFSYQSPIFQDQPNFYLNDTNSNIAIDKRTMQTSQRTEQNVPGTDQLKNEGFGAYGDNPWPKCSMMSFYSAQAFVGDEEDISKEMGSAVLDCAEQQNTLWSSQWDEINSEGGGPS